MIRNVVEANGKKEAKRIARLYYKDKILAMKKEGKSAKEIWNWINKRSIPKSRFKGLKLSLNDINSIVKGEKK